MKRITRTYCPIDNGITTQVWLDANGHWTHDESKAHDFEDDEAEKIAKLLRRIPHAEIEDVENNPNNQEKQNV